jgi:tRNA-modifying protein YgfZ
MPSTPEYSDGTAFLLDAGGWTCIELTGDDRVEWLQGQATNDIRLLKPGHRLSFCLCESTGGLLAVVDAWALEDRIVLTTAREREAAVLDRVERMTILEDVSAAVSPLTLVSVQGADAERDLSNLLDLPDREAGTTEFNGDTLYALRSRRTLDGGWDLLLPAQQSASITERFRTLSAEEYEAARIRAGIPKWGVDMSSKTLPPELGQDFEARHISYQKGCYTGQEVLMRIHSRGHTNRTWVGLLSNDQLPAGATVEREGKPVGIVSSSASGDNGNVVAAAMLRNEAASEGEKVKVDGSEATVRLMPIV